MVYFITDGLNTKIGKADNVEERLKTLQTGNPKILKVALIFDGGLKEEVEYQKLFIGKQTRALNEWYRLNPEQMIPKLLTKHSKEVVKLCSNRASLIKNHYKFNKEFLTQGEIRNNDKERIRKLIIKMVNSNITVSRKKIMKNLGVDMSLVNKVLKEKDILYKVS